ncbi:MAG: ABC transporter substrate-binding protein [Chloroflexota bacterium]
MARKILGLLAVVAIVASACTNASTSPAAMAGPTGAASGSASPAAGPSVTPLDFEQILFGYDYKPEQGTMGGHIVVSDWQAASQLNPVISTSLANSYVFAATMRALFTVTADGHWKPDLAAKMPRFSDDSLRADASGKGFSMDLELKPGLLWSDGQPLTLRDLAYTWQWVLDPAQVGVTTTGWDSIDKIDVAEDGLKATVHFKEPYAGYYGLFGTSFLPEHWMKTIPIKSAAAKSYPLSAGLAESPTNGPYKYESASADTIVLVRNDNWKAGDHAPYLDRITFKYYPDNKEGEIAAFLAGETDVALDLVQTDYDAIKDVDPSFGRALLAPAWLYEHLDLNQDGKGQGHGHPALKDPVVRKAIAQAIDTTAMFETVFPGAPAATDKVCTNAVPSNYWRLPDDRADCAPYDLAAANAALDAAGYTKGADGVRVDPKSKLPLIFEHCSSNSGFRTLGGDFLARSMQQVGIKLNLNFVDSTTVLFANWPDVSADTKCNTYHGTYDTAEFGYSLTFDLFGNYYYGYHSEQIPTEANKGNGFNTVRFNDPEMDAALDVLKAALKPADQLQAVYKVQEQYIKQDVEIALYYRNEVRGYATKIKNLLWNPSSATELWNIEDWFIAP